MDNYNMKKGPADKHHYGKMCNQFIKDHRMYCTNHHMEYIQDC